MSEKTAKYSFIVVKYQGADTAAAALAELKTLSKAKTVKLKDAVAITKTEKGKVKLQQTKDDSAGKGFLKGGALGIVFGLLFGAGWFVAGVVSGTAVGMFDKGIKDKLLKGLGDEMTTEESALAVLIEKADWGTLLADMDSKFSGETIVEEILPEHMDEIVALTANPEIVNTVPEELNIINGD
jgi:uncharacterized membrane protein